MQRPVGELLREWRERRRMSQLELAMQAEISARHLSFVETSRSKPSREMLLNLCEQLDISLRDRNRLLLAAGYAPVYRETPLDAREMSAIRAALAQLLKSHEPYPAAVHDRYWNLVEANASIGIFTAEVDPELLVPPVNVLRLTLHPDGMAGQILNLGECRASVLGHLKRQIDASGDPKLVELYEELRGYPCDDVEPEILPNSPGEIVVPLRMRLGGRDLAFFSTIATFGTALDVTVSELMIESFFPADEATAAFLSR
jgi:transcriptional regulator with XRE-family HTH domain